MFLNPFADHMVIIFYVAINFSVITALLLDSHEKGGLIDAIVITVIVIFNFVFGFVQGYKSEKALEALEEMVFPKGTPKSDDFWKEVDFCESVPDYLIQLGNGTKMSDWPSSEASFRASPPYLGARALCQFLYGARGRSPHRRTMSYLENPGVHRILWSFPGRLTYHNLPVG